MRFYFGFGRSMRLRTLFKWLLPVGIGILAFFGIGNLTVLALDNFQGRTISNTKWCEFGQTNPQANCIAQSSEVYYNVSTNGYTNSIAPVGIQNSNNGRLVPDSHSIFWIYSGVNSSLNPCNTSNNVTFNVIVNPRDINNILAANELNPNSFGGITPTLTASIREAILGFTRKSYTSNSRYYKYLVNENNYGVSAGARYNNNGTIMARDVTQCSFFAYGSNKQLKFRCSLNMTQPSNSLFINIQYTNDSFVQYPGSYNNLRLRDEIVIEEIYDPCNPNNSGNDQQSVVDSINNQSGVISSNTSDIIENNNSNTQEIAEAIERFQNQQDTHSQIIEESLEDIKDAIDNNQSQDNDYSDKLDRLSCNDLYITSNPFIDKIVLIDDGTTVFSSNTKTTDFIKFKTISNVFRTNQPICFYDTNKVKISCTTLQNFSTVPNNSVYFRVSFPRESNQRILNYCIDLLSHDWTSINNNKFFNNIQYADDTPIQNLLYLPIDLAQTIYDSVNERTCTPYTIPFNIFNGNGSNLVFPCVDYTEKIGSTATNILDALICFGLVYGIAMACVKFYEDCSSIKDTFDDLYKGGGY